MGERYDVATIAVFGGHVALDFANTIEDRTSDRPDDTLRRPEDLRRFGVRHGLVAPTVRHATPADLRAARHLRDTLIELLTGVVDRRAATPAPLAVLTRRVATAWQHASLRLDTAPVEVIWPRTAVASITDRVAVAAFDLLSGADVARISRCGNPSCGWFYLDTSKNRSRRWCSMTGCGTDAKNRRRRA